MELGKAQATLQRSKAYELKRGAGADVRILRIRRDRAANAQRQAAGNADRMAIRAPIGGMAVVKTIWKGNSMADVQEGEEVRAGVPVVDIVNPKAMRVRARVNQADVNELRVGQEVRIGLDAYPALFFDGRVTQISPLGVTSVLSPKVRSFVVLVDVKGAHPNLMPDLSASLDVTLARTPGAIVVPRDALRRDGDRTFVRVQRSGGFDDRAVTIGAFNAHEAMLASGLEEGTVIAATCGRRPGGTMRASLARSLRRPRTSPPSLPQSASLRPRICRRASLDGTRPAHRTGHERAVCRYARDPREIRR